MPRISVPVDREFMKKFEEGVPWGIRNSLVKGLIEIALAGERNNIYNIAYTPEVGDKFELRKKEPVE
jgi:hypothetical protein